MTNVNNTYGPVRNVRVIKGCKYSNLVVHNFSDVRYKVVDGLLQKVERLFFDEKIREGDISIQDVLVADKCGETIVLGALERNTYYRVEKHASIQGEPKVDVPVKKTGSRFVGVNDVRKFDPKKLERSEKTESKLEYLRSLKFVLENSKGKKRTRKPQCK